MLSQDVCLSVRPSVTHQYCIETAKPIIKLFQYRVATPFCFFRTKPYGNIPTDPPLTGASNAGGLLKNRDFRQVTRFISEMIQDRATVTMERQ